MDKVHLFNLLREILSVYNIKFSKRYLETLLASISEDHSIVAIVDVLEAFNFNCSIIQFDFQDLIKIEQPFIALMGTNKQHHAVLVTKVDLNHITTISKKFNIQEFQSFWSGIVIIIESKKENINQTNAEQLKKDIQLNFVTVAITFTFCGISLIDLTDSPSNSIKYLLIGLHLIALLICIKLMKLDWLSSSNTLKNCLLSNLDCRKIFKPNGFKSLPFTYSEIGLITFSSIIIFLLSNQIQDSSIRSILVIQFCLNSTFAMYFLYLQAYIFKRYCLLCNSVHIISLTSFIITFATLRLSEFSISLLLICKLLGAYLIPSIIVMGYKSIYLYKSLDEIYLHRKFNYLKNLPSAMEASLREISGRFKFPSYSNFISSSHLTKEPDILIILNINCSKCADIFLQAKTLQDSIVNIKICFLIIHGNAINNQLIRRILIEKDQYGGNKAISLLSDLYLGIISTNQLLEMKSELSIDSKITNQIEITMLEWEKMIKNLQVDSTPFVIIHNKIMPKAMELADYTDFLKSKHA
jgi:uncharacterized membrane protein